MSDGELVLEDLEYDDLKPDIALVKDDELLNELSRRGYEIKKLGVPKINLKMSVDVPLKGFKIGVASCIHYGSRFQQISHFTHFAKLCRKEGCTHLIVLGDLVEGNGKMYTGQVYEMFLHGARAQRNYLIDNFPQEGDMQSIVIGGNHDFSFLKGDGGDVIEEFAYRRKDVTYAGNLRAEISFNNVKVGLMHGEGGVPYARSYRLQKIIEQLSPENKPHIFLYGHLHVPVHVPMYRNVEAFSIACFQSQTPYLQRKGLSPNIQGLILEINYDETGLHKVKTVWENYYKPIEHDY